MRCTPRRKLKRVASLLTVSLERLAGGSDKFNSLEGQANGSTVVPQTGLSGVALLIFFLLPFILVGYRHPSLAVKIAVQWHFMSLLLQHDTTTAENKRTFKAKTLDIKRDRCIAKTVFFET